MSTKKPDMSVQIDADFSSKSFGSLDTRPKERIPELLALIQKVWQKDNVDLRLCQLLVNTIRPRDACPDVYHLEDSALITLLKTRLAEIEGTSPTSDPDR